MICPKCGSDKVTVQIVQTSSKTKSKGNGCLWSLGRWTLIICTLGLWLLVGKRKGAHKTTIQNEKQCLCQNCGNSWKI